MNGETVAEPPHLERNVRCHLHRAPKVALNRATQLTLFAALTGAKHHLDEGTASTGYRPRPAELSDDAGGTAAASPRVAASSSYLAGCDAVPHSTARRRKHAADRRMPIHPLGSAAPLSPHLILDFHEPRKELRRMLAATQCLNAFLAVVD